jgi:hypothetical protein
MEREKAMNWRARFSAYVRSYMMAFDLWPQPPRMPVVSDAESLRRDWDAVMGDLQRAFEKVREEDDAAK